MRISDWSSDVCSSDLPRPPLVRARRDGRRRALSTFRMGACPRPRRQLLHRSAGADVRGNDPGDRAADHHLRPLLSGGRRFDGKVPVVPAAVRSEEHKSELQSLMRISYAVFFLKNKNTNRNAYEDDTM